MQNISESVGLLCDWPIIIILRPRLFFLLIINVFNRAFPSLVCYINTGDRIFADNMTVQTHTREANE